MELNVNSLADFVSQAQILWAKGYMSIEQSARNSGLFREVPIPMMTGDSKTFSEIDLEEYASKKGESEQADRARVQQGYSKTGYLYRVAKDIGISFEMRSRGKYPEIIQKLTNLGKLGVNRLDLDLSHRIGFGTATSYTDKDGDVVDLTVGDTLALFVTNHTLRGSGTTFRNRLANNPQVSPGAIEAMQRMRIDNCYNQLGESLSLTDDIIWSTNDPNTVRTISEILRSSTNVTQNNSGVINTFAGQYRHVILPRVDTTAAGVKDSTKAKIWGTACSEMSSAYLGMHEEPHMKLPPVNGANNEEFSTDDFNFGTRGGWMIVIAGAGWISLSTGDGTA